MKKVIRTIALVALLGAATSCQKEDYSAPVAMSAETTVCCSINGLNNNVVLGDEESWDIFINRMLALAREGYEVTIFSPYNTLSAKETVTFTTDNGAEATLWAKNMLKQGYNVHIDYDDKTGIYTCTAIK